jgi:indolepyruvate ferredoxin oxidoreductase beta subunit
MDAVRPLSILIGALGGEGGGVLAQWIVEAAAAAGFPAQSTSIPGVAQRTGATTYYVEIYPERTQRRPVLSLYPVPGRVDLVVSSELLETARIVASGMVSPDRTTLLTSTARTLTTAEKMALGDGRFESDRLLDVARTHSRRLVAFDMESIARETKTVTSAVMFGAVAGSGVLPLERAACEEVIRRDGRGAEASLAGFARGLAATTHESPASKVPATSSEAPTVEGFPPSTQAFAGLGLARVVDFQDRVYGELYLRRLTRVLDFEKRHPAGEYEVTRECARYLALWMAFDDVIRVASLKTKAARFARVRREVGAGDADVVRIADYFKPGMPEIAGLLPPSWARRLVAWDRARAAKGEPPFGFALTLRTSTIRGFATLRLLAALRGLRPRSARYAEEQRMIEAWLDAIVHAPDWESARELALCGRLVKGYGATNERGKRNLLHIVDQLSRRGADAIRDAREAALADEGGKSLDRALAAHGAQPRPVVAQPIRFVRTKAAPR